jgi:hypothetical protein
MSSVAPPYDLACAIEALVAAYVAEGLRAAQAAKKTAPDPRRSKEELAQIKRGQIASCQAAFNGWKFNRFAALQS